MQEHLLQVVLQELVDHLVPQVHPLHQVVLVLQVYQVEVAQVLLAHLQVQTGHQVHLVLQVYQVRVDQVLHQLLQAVQVPQLLQVHLAQLV